MTDPITILRAAAEANSNGVIEVSAKLVLDVLRRIGTGTVAPACDSCAYHAVSTTAEPCWSCTWGQTNYRRRGEP